MFSSPSNSHSCYQAKAVKHILSISLCVLAVSTANASDIDLRVTSGGTSVIWVQTGQTVTYEVRGELTDNLNQGLAFFAFDLEFDGGDLSQAQAPVSANMLNFATPLGLNNPAGFGGTVNNGDLIQIGGAQNTINQSFAAAPTGLVMTGIAAQGAPELLVIGTLTTPMTTGTYFLSPTNLNANVIDASATGTPFWTVSAAGAGTVQGLVLHVSDCAPASNYCVGKTNSTGCIATLSATGAATLTGPNNFAIHASDVVNKRFGLMFWGTGTSNLPWLGGTLCVAPPLHRLGVRFSGGAGPAGTNCNGQINQFFSQTLMNNQGLLAGDVVSIQCWYRDPGHPDGTGVAMTDALSFTICP
jgi:hypothetical protein